MKFHHDRESLGELAMSLQVAREAAGLSQRALSQKIGVPQSHISKIESGKVDLKCSSLIEFAHALGLEVMLVPVAAAGAVAELTKPADVPADPRRARVTVRETRQALKQVARKAGRVSRMVTGEPELLELSEIASALSGAKLDLKVAQAIQEVLGIGVAGAGLLHQIAALQTGAPTAPDTVPVEAVRRAAAKAAKSLTLIFGGLMRGEPLPPVR